MRSYIITLIFILLSFGIVSAKKKIDFNNKFLLYSQDIKIDNSFWANFFVFNGENYRIEPQVPFGYRYKVDRPTGPSLIPKEVNRIYVTKEKNSVFYTYDFEGEKIYVKRYSKIPKDTCRFNDNSNFTHVIASVFTGKDTTIVFNNTRIKCWKFTEWDFFSGVKTYYEKYLDKKNFLPIIIDEYKIELHPGLDSLLQKKRFVLRMVLDSSEVKSKEWRFYNDPLDAWTDSLKTQR